ncbi:MAG: thymidine kinase [Bacilli bacterium]|nr:thymidine kinase [Bacilli bacterium]
MAKLHFKYASMNSGKSIDLLRTVYNYEENGFKVLVLKPKVDTKGKNNIKTRIGLEREVDFLIDENDNIIDLLSHQLKDIASIFVDEVQFLSKDQIDELFIISKAIDIPIICYGLRNNFKMEAFEGSKRLLEIADVLEEFPTLCACGNIARYVGRKHNGNYEEEGEEVIIDGTEQYEYVPLCGNCYLTKVKKLDFKTINK